MVSQSVSDTNGFFTWKACIDFMTDHFECYFRHLLGIADIEEGETDSICKTTHVHLNLL